MDIPKNTAQPFFAYGIFRPGQIGFLQLKELVFEVMEPSYIDGTLLLRDGLPIIDPCKCGRTKGVII